MGTLPLTAEERIDLIKRISQSLGRDGWTGINLVLEQFGCIWDHSYSGSGEEYAIWSLEGETDENLLAIEKYLIQSEGTRIGQTAPFWKEGFFRLFLSHVSHERAFVSEIKEALEPFGIDGFVAHRDIQPTREWIEEMELGLRTCRALVAVLHRGFKESEWTDQEVGFCLGRGTPVITVKIDLDPYGFIGRYQAVPGHHTDPEGIADGIRRILMATKETSSSMARAFLYQFERAKTFSQVTELAGLLGEIKPWTPELLARLAIAPSENPQIGIAEGVQWKIREILELNGGPSIASFDPFPFSPPPISPPDDDLPF